MGRALIVSAGANSNEYIAARLSEMGYSRPVIIPSGAEARRRMSESDFELIVVNAPLPDEFGHELCITAVEQTDAGVVFLVKAAQAEQLLAPLNEQGVLRPPAGQDRAAAAGQPGKVLSGRARPHDRGRSAPLP